MTDVFTAEKRSEIMRSIRGAKTKPEQAVAKWLRRHGIKYRRCVRGLPGRPDFVLPEHGLAVFVHGCFWHGHKACPKGRNRPRTRAAFWAQKIKDNQRRDARAARELRALGFAAFVLWECRLKAGRMPARFLAVLRRARRDLPGTDDRLLRPAR